MWIYRRVANEIHSKSSGYAQEALSNKDNNYNKNRWKRLLKFILHFELILIIFSIIGLFIGSADIPVSLNEFIGNMFLYGLSYNGAWWFVVTYILLIIIYPYLRKINDRINPVIMLCVSFTLYFIGYIFEFQIMISTNNAVLNWIFTQVLLLARTQLPFVVGMIVCKHGVVEKLKNMLNNIRYKNLILAFIVLIMFVFHCVVQSLIVAPFTGIVTIMCFHLWDKPAWIESGFSFLGYHSTNIWLTHMFFYLTLFKDMVFKVKYPLFILIYMMVVCIIVSIIINYIEGFIRKSLKK